MLDHGFPDSVEYTSYPLSELLAAPRPVPRPDDFADFWRETFDELSAMPYEVRVETDDSVGGRSIELISFRSSSGGRVLGWLIGPGLRQAVRRGLVISHGYGGRELPDPQQVPDDAAAIFPVAPWLPINSGGVPGAKHVLIGIGDRYRYSHRFSVADIWRAASILLQRHPDAEACLDYRGGSFGGGIGALALPWDTRFRRATLDVPSFGHFPIRLSRPCTGSGEAVRRHLISNPEHRSMLDYFDSSVAAARISIAVQVSAARLDPAVDPRGQFAVYHALAGPRRLAVRTAGHAEFPGEAAEVVAVELAARRFLAAADVDELPAITDLSG